MKCVQKYSDVTETKHGIVEFSLRVVFEMNGSKANRVNITGPVLIQKTQTSVAAGVSTGGRRSPALSPQSPGKS